MSWGGRIVAALLLAVAAVAGLLAYTDRRDDKAEQRGIDKQVAAEIGRANQEIATRRVTDAHFDSHDARALCGDYGLDWVFENGKSLCR